MPGKTPQRNGKPPTDRVTRSSKDVEMTDDKSAPKGKGAAKKGAKEGEDMTVVVPPAKSARQPSQPAADADGDVAMDVDEESTEVKIDPVTQAISGKSLYEDSRACGLVVDCDGQYMENSRRPKGSPNTDIITLAL